jgi:signal transduction histidine kinase
MLLAHSDSGADLLHRTRVDLTGIAHESLTHIAPLIEARKLRLQADITGSQVWSEGDPQFLRQLFVILLDNAVKYTPQGQITASLSVADRHAAFVVADTGIGIEPSDLKSIFDRFYCADKARSRKSGGSGLGLSIGLWIAEAHGGRITAKSTPGVGSEFSVYLPLSSVESQRFGSVSQKPKTICRT